MLTIRQAQLQTLSEVIRKMKTVSHAKSTCPEHTGQMPESNLRQMIQYG